MKNVLKKAVSLMLVFVLVIGFTFSASLATELPENNKSNYVIELVETKGNIPILLEGENIPQTRAIPNFARFGARYVNGNQAVASVTNIGVDTIDRVQVKATVYHNNGNYAGKPTYNEYGILPLFYRTFYYNYSNIGTIVFNVEV